MCAYWKKEFDPTMVASRFEEIKRVKDNDVSFTGWGYQEYHTILESMIEYDSKIPIHVQRTLQRNAIKKAAQKGHITPKKVIRYVSIEESEYLKKPDQPFVLLTHCTIKNNISLPRFVIDGATITFSSYIPQQFKGAHVSHYERAKSYFRTETPSNSICARIRVNAKDVHGATGEAIDKIDFIRSLMNLNLTHYSRNTYGGPSTPVNIVLLGPLHTLHNPNGSEVTDYFWYQPDYYAKNAVNINSKVEKMLASISRLRKQIKHHNYSKTIIEALLRYGRALDYSDHNRTILHLWSIIELLTDTIDRGYKISVKRTAALYEEMDYHSEVLTHLKEYRNKFVHSGRVIDNIESYVYQLKRYVEKLLYFHISNYFNFQDLKQAGEFLDYASRDVKYYKEQKKLLEDILEFRNITA